MPGSTFCPDGRPWVTPAKVEGKSWTMFQDRAMAPEIIEDLFPEEDVVERDFIERVPCTGSVNCVPEISEGQVMTHPHTHAFLRWSCAVLSPPRHNAFWRVVYPGGGSHPLFGVGF